MQVTLTGANQQVVTAFSTADVWPVAGRYLGFSIRETSGVAAALVRIYDGTNASGQLLEEISLGMSESARENYGADPIPFSRGLWLNVVSGAVAGTVRVTYGQNV